MTTGTELMERAGILLGDVDAVRWTPQELCRWINEGMNAIVLAKPSAKSGTRILSLETGTWQKVVDVAGSPTPIKLLDIVRNVTGDTDPRVGGRAVKMTSRNMLDSVNPSWHDPASVPYAATVKQACFDEENPLEFYVYPGNNGTGFVEALCSEAPTELVASGDASLIASYAAEIDLRGTYEVPLLDYVCYRAQMKDATEGNAGVAANHYTAFATALGIKVQVAGATTPNRQRAPS